MGSLLYPEILILTYHTAKLRHNPDDHNVNFRRIEKPNFFFVHFVVAVVAAAKYGLG
jgi:hypothetical protein